MVAGRLWAERKRWACRADLNRCACRSHGRVTLKGSIAVNTLRFAGFDAVATLRKPLLAALRPLVSKSLPAAQPSAHSALASKPLNSQACETALAKALMSGTSRCSGILGISS